MISSQLRKRILLFGITLISLGSFSTVYSLDINMLFKLYGLLFTCQISFLLFFVSRIRFSKH